jgi:predicted nucleic acid-binding protein
VILVVDASVALKWFLNVGESEPDRDRALTLLNGVDNESVQLVEPAHFIAEVAAVLARVKPDAAEDDLLDLLNIEYRTIETQETYARALELSIRYQHHPFDTLYHAVALDVPGASLVTADRRYYDKAGGEGRIILLADWSPG